MIKINYITLIINCVKINVFPKVTIDKVQKLVYCLKSMKI